MTPQDKELQELRRECKRLLEFKDIAVELEKIRKVLEKKEKS